MNEIVGIVGIGIIGVFAVWGSVKSFIMVDDIIVIFNGFDYHLHNVIGSDLWSFVILRNKKLKIVKYWVGMSVPGTLECCQSFCRCQRSCLHRFEVHKHRH